MARIQSLLVKPVAAACNLDCSYCFYLDRAADPYRGSGVQRMTAETLERLVDSFLFYSYPNSAFVFQGGEPTLAGLPFYERLIDLQKRYGRNGQSVTNALQTNGVLLDDNWCSLLREYNWLVGLSLDGPEAVHDAWRKDRQGAGTWRRVIRAVETLGKNRVEFNVLCVLSTANIANARELYRFFRGLGIEHLQYIPLAEFDSSGNPLPFTVTAEQYGRFLVETFDAWWADRRRLHIRLFDNLAEAAAGQAPSNCTMAATCDSYCVVEHNGDVYPCDFFVEAGWKLGNIMSESWNELAARERRLRFAAKKTEPNAGCAACEYASICHQGCPRLRRARFGRYEDRDWFCEAYRTIFSKALPKLRPPAVKTRQS